MALFHRRLLVSAPGLTVLAIGACRTTVLVPAQVDLQRYGTIGIVTFSANGEGAELAELGSREFMAAVQQAQPGVPILELGDADALLAAVKREALDPETVRVIGRKYGVDAIILGHLDLERVRPKVKLGSLADSLNARAEVQGTLNARILQSRSGATIWTESARGAETVAHLGLAKGSLPSFGMGDPEQAYGALVRGLVVRATGDFRPRYEKR